MIRFPYGMADFRQIITEEYFYCDVLIEFKFLSLKALGLSGENLRDMGSNELCALPLVTRALENGKAQAMDYGDRLARKYRDLKLKCFVLVSLGFERICYLNAADLEREAD